MYRDSSIMQRANQPQLCLFHVANKLDIHVHIYRLQEGQIKREKTINKKNTSKQKCDTRIFFYKKIDNNTTWNKDLEKKKYL